MSANPDKTPVLGLPDQEEMHRMERCAMLTAFLVAELESHKVSEAHVDQVLSAWACAWWDDKE